MRINLRCIKTKCFVSDDGLTPEKEKAKDFPSYEDAEDYAHQIHLPAFIEFTSDSGWAYRLSLPSTHDLGNNIAAAASSVETVRAHPPSGSAMR